ncbi:MAG: HAD family hydrolase [Micromonosporaceae bacterium]
MKTLILWDIDHTLIENGGVSKETYAAAFEILTGSSPAHRPQTDGRTDPVIMRNLFAANGITFTAAYDDQLFDALVKAMASNRTTLMTLGSALPGVVDLLSELRRDPSIVQSVLTGNISDNARAKLESFDLDKYIDFEVGGFGSDDPVRSKLVAIAQRRASEKYGAVFDRTSTVLVGDTVRDVDAALHGGARIISVTTGIDDETVLRDAGADEVLPDLTDAAAFREAMRRVLAKP